MCICVFMYIIYNIWDITGKFPELFPSIRNMTICCLVSCDTRSGYELCIIHVLVPVLVLTPSPRTCTHPVTPYLYSPRHPVLVLTPSPRTCTHPVTPYLYSPRHRVLVLTPSPSTCTYPVTRVLVLTLSPEYLYLPCHPVLALTPSQSTCTYPVTEYLTFPTTTLAFPDWSGMLCPITLLASLSTATEAPGNIKVTKNAGKNRQYR